MDGRMGGWGDGGMMERRMNQGWMDGQMMEVRMDGVMDGWV